MLRELSNIRQVPGEDRRRWFYCHEMDLVVWEQADGSISGFQLAYDKDRAEHSISWQQLNGWAHYAVDDGEPLAGINSTPLLYADGPFMRDRVLDRFLTLSGGVPPDIARLVAARLREFGD